MKHTRLFWVVTAIAIALSLSTAPTFAAAPAFPSKDITYVLPTAPGGGFDTQARILAPYLEKYLPRKVNVIIKNMPGGGWTIGLTHTYRAAPDGHTICFFNMPGNVTHMIVGRAKYDLTKYTWLGTPAVSTFIACRSPKSPYKTLKDFQKAKQVIAGTVGIASTAGLGQILSAKAMGIKLKVLPHDGSVPAVLAAIRGDVDWVQFHYGVLGKYLKSGDLIPMWVYAKERLPVLPDTPTIVELGYEELLEVAQVYRAIAAPPGVPDNIAKILIATLQKAANDPGFIAAMKKARMEPVYWGPKVTSDKVAQSLKRFMQYKDTLLQYLK